MGQLLRHIWYPSLDPPLWWKIAVFCKRYIAIGRSVRCWKSTRSGHRTLPWQTMTKPNIRNLALRLPPCTAGVVHWYITIIDVGFPPRPNRCTKHSKPCTRPCTQFPSTFRPR